MKDINEWFAEKCGVDLSKGFEGQSYFDDYGFEVWSIQDPRCREIIRERFKIETIWTHLPEMWMSEARYDGKDYSEEAQTIAEAEIACLTAIYEQESA